MVLMMHTALYSEALYEEMMLFARSLARTYAVVQLSGMAGYEDYRTAKNWQTRARTLLSSMLWASRW